MKESQNFSNEWEKRSCTCSNTGIKCSMRTPSEQVLDVGTMLKIKYKQIWSWSYNTKCAFYSTFNFFIYVQINKWLINREKICVLNGNTDPKILLNPCKETFLYKHFCGNFSDISFKVNIFYNEKYRYFESTPW